MKVNSYWKYQDGSLEKFIKDNAKNFDELPVRQISNVGCTANHGIKIAKLY